MPINEVNASAGKVGTTYRLVLSGRDPAVRVNHGPGRVATVTNLGGGTVRWAPIDNHGEYGDFTELDPEATAVTVGSNGPDVVFMALQPDVQVAIVVVVSAPVVEDVIS